MSTNDNTMERLNQENQTLVQTLSTMGARLETSVKLLSTIFSLTTIPIQTKTLDQAADKILKTLVQQMDNIEGCSLLIHDPSTGHLKLLAARGQDDLWGDGNLEYNTTLTFKPGEGVAGRVFMENTPCFCDKNTPEYEWLKTSPGLSVPESLACLPLSLSDKTLGVINISFTIPKPFTPPRRRDLTLLAGVVANIIQTFILKAEVEEKASSLQSMVHEYQREIRERKLAENARWTSEERYRRLFDSINDAIYTHDLEGRLLSLNPVGAENLGYRLEELVGHSILDFTPERFKDAFQWEYLDKLVSDKRCEGIGAILSKSGNTQYIEFSSTLVEQENGETFVSGSGRDVTERIQAQRELEDMQNRLIQVQKMEAIGTLASGIAHDFNNILQGISGYTQLLLNKTLDEEFRRKYLNEIDQSSQRAAELVKQLLTFGRKMDINTRTLNVKQEFNRVSSLLQRVIPKMVQIEHDIPDEIWPIEGDAVQLERVLMNLGINAADAMQGQGVIRFNFINKYLSEQESNSDPDLKPGPYLVIRVVDNGPGMDEDTLSRIFEPFFTTKPVGQGTGLGLSMVYGIVRNHQGSIACHSEPGQGTVFEILLPASPGKMTEIPLELQTTEPLTGTETILLVDDDESVVEVAEEILEEFGYNVLKANDGETALSLFGNHDDNISAVVLDLGMPGMGGQRCLEEMLHHDPHAKIIIASGYAADGPIQRALDSGAVAYLSKPYNLVELVAKVRTVLNH